MFPILVFMPIVALFAWWLAAPFVGRRYLRVVDRRRISADGATAQGVVKAISPPSRQGICRVQIEFALNDGGGTYRITQRSTDSAVRKLGLAAGSSVAVRYLPEKPPQAFVHELVLAERGLPTAAASLAEGSNAHLFYVAFKGPNKFNWRDQGDIVIDGLQVQFNALKHRPFWYPRWQRLDVALDDIFDAAMGGEAVQCTIGGADGANRRLLFRTAGSAEAGALWRLLPAAKTTEFVESAAYQATLSQLQPNMTVTRTIILLNVLAFLVTAALGGGFIGSNPEVMVRFGTDYTPLTLGGEWWRLLTSTFLHFGLLHIALNMWVLYLNGPLVERLYGPARYLFIYLMAGLAGSVASLLWHPFVNGAGASGAIFGIFGALLAFFLRRESGVPASVAKANLRSAAVFVVYNLGFSSTISGIDNAAHLGGLAAGFVFGFLLSQPIDPVARASRPWKRQWAVALGVACAAAALLAFYLGTGKLAPRTAHGPDGKVIPRQALAPRLLQLGGVRLGMTPDEVRAKRGSPIARDSSGWVYNSVDAIHDGVIRVGFATAAAGKPEAVVSVEFIGHDAASAPPEFPYLNDATPEEAIRLFGKPLQRRQSGPWTVIWFANGAYITAYNDKVSQYGIFELSQSP